MHPVVKARKTEAPGPKPVPFPEESSDIIAVGPIVTGLVLPRKMYTKQPR